MFDRRIFFDGCREEFGKLLQPQVDGLNFLLHRLEKDFGDIYWLAYILATVKHETADTFQPVMERGKGKGRAYGQNDPATGQAYYGRGYCQLTWGANYRKFARKLGLDLYRNPGLALEPDTAYRILVMGMRDGLFTGKKLSDYLKGESRDYQNARRIVNGVDRAEHIAQIAVKFEKILESAKGKV